MRDITKHQITDNPDHADVIVINSCTVTNFADKTLKEYLKKHKNKKILLTGCAAYTIGKELFAKGVVFGVFGHSYKEHIDDILSWIDPFVELGNLEFVNTNIVTSFSKTRAFIKIQEGCDFECGYCIIPQVRGKARSVDEALILRQIEILAQKGFREFVLTGINMGSYGKDTNTSLSELLKKIFQIKRIKRIRLGSLEPSQIDDEFLDVITNPILERHLHIALQYADDEMLRIMKRRNRVKQTLDLFEKLSQKGFALGTDYIVAHPKETEEIFQRGYEMLSNFPLTHIHVFRYSPRSMTHSATLDGRVDTHTAKKRVKLIQDLIRQKNYTFRQQKPKLTVLIEQFKNGYYTGYDEYYNPMFIKASDNLTGKWLEVEDYEVRMDGNYKDTI